MGQVFTVSEYQKEKEQNSQKVWVLIRSKGLGGAERRGFKVACQISQKTKFDIVVLINISLWNEYQKDIELMKLLDQSDIKIVVYNEENKFFYPFIKRIKTLLRSKYRFLNNFYVLLFLSSWYHILNKLTSQGDIIHVFADDAARNAALIMAYNERKVLLEITSNRLVERVSKQVHTITSRNGKIPSNNLMIRCVSKTVYDNMQTYLQKDYYRSNNINFAYYRGPFLMEADRFTEPNEKENIIVFGHRFVASKNPILFCNVVKNLLDDKKISGWKVLIRGKGSLEHEMSVILKKYIDSGIVSIGFTYELKKELTRSKIFVSLISQGSYPSQSVFEAMKYGNLIILGDVGLTKKIYNHPDIYFCDIDEKSVRKVLSRAIHNSTLPSYYKKSSEMQNFYHNFVKDNLYSNEVIKIYSQKTNC